MQHSIIRRKSDQALSKNLRSITYFYEKQFLNQGKIFLYFAISDLNATPGEIFWFQDGTDTKIGLRNAITLS